MGSIISAGTAGTAGSAGAGAGTAGVSAVTSLLSPVGLGVGGVFVAAALVLLLAYYDLLGASERDFVQVRQALLATVVPLGLTFGAIVLFKSMQVVG